MPQSPASNLSDLPGQSTGRPTALCDDPDFKSSSLPHTDQERQLSRLLLDSERLNRDIASLRGELNGYIWQRTILWEVTSQVWKSPSWRFTKPLRRISRFFGGGTLTEAALLPATPVEELAPRHWTTLGHLPQLLLPCLPTEGWVRISLDMWTSAASRAHLYFDTGRLFTELESVELGAVAGDTRRDLYLFLPMPAHCFRFDPMRAPGEFKIRSFRIEPLSGLGADIEGYKRARSFGEPTLAEAAKHLLRGKVSKARHVFRRSLPLRPGEGWNDYDVWRQSFRPTASQKDTQRKWAAGLADPPLISVLLPTYNTPAEFLRAAIDSVIAQTYPHWELCIADDGSRNAEVRKILQEYAGRDPRIKVVFCENNAGISAASNFALEIATGQFVALLDHDDVLEDHALNAIAREVIANPDLDWIYSDEDKLTPEGRFIEPFFKPEFSPEFLLGCMYTSHLTAYRTSLVRSVGGFRSDFDGSQDHDLALRVMARSTPDRVRHIPDVLYHWRIHATSTAGGISAKPTAWDAGQRAVTDYLAAAKIEGKVVRGPSDGLHRVKFTVRGRPRVSIIIPSACRLLPNGTYWARECVERLRDRSTYPNIQVIVIGPPEISPDLAASFNRLRVQRLAYDLPFNFSQACNAGAAASDGEHLIFLNDDCEVSSPDWIEEMLGFSQQQAIGAVGARLNFPSGALQHAGVTILGGHPGHAFYNFPADHSGYYFSSRLVRNWSAVTAACVMIRRSVFDEVGGFDLEFPLNYNDVDLCLRIREAGYRIVCTPYAQLVHHESVTKSGLLPHEQPQFWKRWKSRFPRDPYYNPNLSSESSDYRIAVNRKDAAVEAP